MPIRTPIDPAAVTVRHIRRGNPADQGAVQILGVWFTPQPLEGVNGRSGFVSGSYERRIGDDGTFSLRFPNTAGGDRVMHRARFAVATDPGYRPGEEWVELTVGGRLVFVGTTTSYRITRTDVTISGKDAGRLLAKARAGEAEDWHHAPRDVIDNYTRLPVLQFQDQFTAVPLNASAWTTSLTGDSGITFDTATGMVAFRAGGTGGPHAARATTISSPFQDGPGASPWRIEARTRFRSRTPYQNLARFGAVDASGNYIHTLWMTRTQMGFEGGRAMASPFGDFTDVTWSLVTAGRWVLGYINGQLVGAQPQITALTSLKIRAEAIALTNGAGTGDAFLYVDEIAARTLEPALLRGADKGDYRTPGAPTPGGLSGRYYNEIDLRPPANASFYFDNVLSPTRAQYAQRIDANLDFAMASPPAWAPPGGPDSSGFFSARWTGSIYLDLAAADWRLRFNVVDGVRAWVGRTQWGQQHVDYWSPADTGTVTAATQLRASLGTTSGWYPIVVEFATFANNGQIQMQWERSDTAGTWTTVPSDKLSPYGCVNDRVRLDAHREIVEQIAGSFGYQWTCSPRQLESGEFPGQIIPRLREGRDTDLVVDQDAATGVEVAGDADDAIDELVADAAGIADVAAGSQLTSRTMDSPAAAGHLMIHSDYESLADITDRTLLAQRASSLLALRGSPWEQISARPLAGTQLADAFTVTGQLAVFDWLPGDGVRVDFEDVAVRDTTPRQIQGVTWPITPAGRGAPTLQFRERPRSLRETLRRIQRAALGAQRNYQGQLVVVSSNVASIPAGSAVTDDNARVSLPNDLGDVVSCTLVVQHRSDTTSGGAASVRVNGAVVSGLTIVNPGRYDLTPYVSRDGARARMYVSVTGGLGLTEFMVELLVRV